MAAIFYGLFGYFGWYFLQFNGHFCILHYLLIYIACLVSNWFRIVRWLPWNCWHFLVSLSVLRLKSIMCSRKKTHITFYFKLGTVSFSVSLFEVLWIAQSRSHSNIRCCVLYVFCGCINGICQTVLDLSPWPDFRILLSARWSALSIEDFSISSVITFASAVSSLQCRQFAIRLWMVIMVYGPSNVLNQPFLSLAVQVGFMGNSFAPWILSKCCYGNCFEFWFCSNENRFEFWFLFWKFAFSLESWTCEL